MMEEFDLPIEIIQHIQSFLDGGEAARTCLLSKYWYHAWSTRPILVFDKEKSARSKKEDLVEFWNYVGKNMTRYKQFKLKLEKLVLGYRDIDDDDDDDDDEGYSYSIDELIADTSAMGITELDLKNGLSHDLLAKVLAIKSLTKLSVKLYGYIRPRKQNITHLDGKVLCSSLLSLTLHDAYVKDQVIIDILLGCPLIQTLDLNYFPPDKRTHRNRVDNWTDDIVLCPSLVSLSLYGTFAEDDYVIENILFASPHLEKLDFSGNRYRNTIFPAKVFAMRSLTRLVISECKIHIEAERVLCSHLVSLRLYNVEIGDDAIGDIFLGCTLLENLDMNKCEGMSNINISKLVNLVALRIHHCHPKRQDNNCNFSVSSTLRFSKVSFGSINMPEFHKLHSVSLRYVMVNSEFFTNFSSKFPRLKDLTLEHCTGYGSSIHISSKSLECFQLYHEGLRELQSAKFDVQNIRKFVISITYDHIPLLSFHTESKEWESTVSFCSFGIESSWFVKLREFLKELSLSRISLEVSFSIAQLNWVKDLTCSSIPVVENLEIYSSTPTPVTHELLCALFRCCRPTFINNLDLSCAKLLNELFIINQNIANHAKCFNKMQSLLMYDLEEIDLEIFKEKEWQSTPLTKFVEDVLDSVITCRANTDQFRFRLKWGAFRCTI